MPYTYDLCLKIHGMVNKELCLHDSWPDEQGECSHKYMYVQLGAWNIKKRSMAFEKSSTGLRNCINLDICFYYISSALQQTQKVFSSLFKLYKTWCLLFFHYANSNKDLRAKTSRVYLICTTEATCLPLDCPSQCFSFAQSKHRHHLIKKLCSLLIDWLIFGV